MKLTAIGRSFETEKNVFKNPKKNFIHMLNVLNERREREPACTSSCKTYQQKSLKFRQE